MRRATCTPQPQASCTGLETDRTACPGTAAHVPLFLYPFLNTTSKTRPFEYLRLTSLGVIGALVKVT
jgi:Cell differentiation family, Rcd1-like